MNWFTQQLMAIVLPLIIGPAAFLLTQWIKRQWARVDALPPERKQIIVAAWAFALSLLSETLGASVCLDGGATCDPSGVAWKTVLSYAVAVTMHGIKRGGAKDAH